MKSKSISALLLCVMLSTMIASCAPSWTSITNDRDRIVEQISGMNGLQVRLPKAFDEVGKYSGMYPSHYLTDQNVLGRLDAAERSLDAITAQNTGWLVQLNNAIENKDRKKAQEALTEIDSKTPEIQAIIELVLGPPGANGLFRQLELKVLLLKEGYVKNDGKDLFAETKDLDLPAMAKIQAAVKENAFYLCNTTSKMTYKSAFSSYGSGVAFYQQAERQNVTEVEGKIDLPAVSDSLVQAYSAFDAVKTSVSNAPGDHTNAVNAINVANSSKVWADAAVLNIFADYYSTVVSERSSGVTDLDNANASCLTEDFASAKSDAESAKKHFDLAVYWSTQEEPESEPVAPDNNDDEVESIWPDITDYPDNSDDYYDDSSNDYYDDSSDDYYDDSGSWIPGKMFVFYDIPIYSRKHENYQKFA